MHRNSLHTVSALLFSLVVLAWPAFAAEEFEKQAITFHEIIEEAIRQDTGSPVIIKNRRIVRKYRSVKSLSKFLRSKYGDNIFNSEGQLLIKRDIVINQCQSDQGLEWTDMVFERSLNIYFSTFNEIVVNGIFQQLNLTDNNTGMMRVMSADFSGAVEISNNQATSIKLENSMFRGMVKVKGNELKSELRISGNQFQPVTGFECTVVNDTLSYGRAFSHNIQVEVDNASQTDLMINDNTFYATEPYQRIKIRGLLNELIIENNTLQSTLDLTGLAIEKRLIISDNHLEGYIAFNDLIFPEIFNLVRWEQVSGNKIIVLEKLRSSNTALWVNLIECNPEVMVMEDKEELFAFPYHGLNQLELYNENAFEKLIYSYKSLYTIYNQRGDLESANACYSEMKDVQRRRLKYIFDTRGGFQNYFRWQLNVLLKVYTNHGTDPALAMVISVYVILFFGFVYFFFPSEWDVASKGKLIQDFREFSQKNDKGYLKPFITVLFGFGVSMVNALTLSLNSFVTLGFGNIPTKGFARYVCVIEGFIGWFLLSIFTVALINQVLA